MKKILLLFITILSFTFNAKADTISVWRVYFNNIQIQQLSDIRILKTIVFGIDSLKSTDSITVEYLCDTPCHDCKTQLNVKIQKDKSILTSNGVGSFSPISFALKDLIAYKLNTKQDTFDVFYSDGFRRSNFLFRIKLE
jgi:hypothetical protein